jgi:hypothetical protein
MTAIHDYLIKLYTCLTADLHSCLCLPANCKRGGEVLEKSQLFVGVSLKIAPPFSKILLRKHYYPQCFYEMMHALLLVVAIF